MLTPLLSAALVAALTAAPGIDVSTDDVTYASSLGGPVIASNRLVPGDSMSGEFYLRNSAAVSAYLELELANPRWTDAAYAAAISVRVGVPGETGNSIPLNSSLTCPVFLSGVLLAPDESILVTATVSLGNLDGTTGQDAAASLDLTATLTEAIGGVPGPPCATPSGTPGAGAPGSRTTTVTVLPTEALPGPSVNTPSDAPTRDPANDVRGNTGYDFDGSPFWWALAAVAIGVVLFLLLAGRRRSREDHE